jgi:hypothetical protein
MESGKFAEKPSNKAVWDDYTDFSLEIIDNGDDKVTVFVNLDDEKRIEL